MAAVPDHRLFTLPRARNGADVVSRQQFLTSRQVRLDQNLQNIRAANPNARITGCLGPAGPSTGPSHTYSVVEFYRCVDCPARIQWGGRSNHLSDLRRHLEGDRGVRHHRHDNSVIARQRVEAAGGIWNPGFGSGGPVKAAKHQELLAELQVLQRDFPTSHFDGWAEGGMRSDSEGFLLFMCHDCGDNQPWYSKEGKHHFRQHLFTEAHSDNQALGQWQANRARFVVNLQTGSITNNGLSAPVEAPVQPAVIPPAVYLPAMANPPMAQNPNPASQPPPQAAPMPAPLPQPPVPLAQPPAPQGSELAEVQAQAQQPLAHNDDHFDDENFQPESVLARFGMLREMAAGFAPSRRVQAHRNNGPSSNSDSANRERTRYSGSGTFRGSISNQASNSRRPSRVNTRGAIQRPSPQPRRDQYTSSRPRASIPLSQQRARNFLAGRNESQSTAEHIEALEAEIERLRQRNVVVEAELSTYRSSGAPRIRPPPYVPAHYHAPRKQAPPGGGYLGRAEEFDEDGNFVGDDLEDEDLEEEYDEEYEELEDDED